MNWLNVDGELNWLRLISEVRTKRLRRIVMNRHGRRRGIRAEKRYIIGCLPQGSGGTDAKHESRVEILVSASPDAGHERGRRRGRSGRGMEQFRAR